MVVCKKVRKVAKKCVSSAKKPSEVAKIIGKLGKERCQYDK